MSFNRFKKHFPLVAPSWVVKQVERKKLSAATLLDLTALAAICSMEDLASMFCLNNEPNYVTKIFGSGSLVNPGLAEHWFNHHHTAYTRMLDVSALYKDTAMERLYQPNPSDVPIQFPTVSRINAQQADIEAILITLKPGQLGGTDNDAVQQHIVREYMRQLYVFTDYATLAQDALFKRYLLNVTSDDVSEPA